jgi:hypothetical protein
MGSFVVITKKHVTWLEPQVVAEAWTIEGRIQLIKCLEILGLQGFT